MSVLVTGAAGFIGSHVCHALLARGEHVVGIDNFDPTYDRDLKRARLDRLRQHSRFEATEADAADRAAMTALFDSHGDLDCILHLAARAGVRQSMIEPDIYIANNIGGQAVLLDLAARLGHLRHFVYASSSSVYGANQKVPFAPEDPVKQPRSVYGVTKRSCELLAECFAHAHGIKVTGLRYFTVYGPWGRPDMAPHIFVRSILAGTPVPLFHFGRTRRDFTYIDDIVAGTLAAADQPAATPGHRIYNLGGSQALDITHVVSLFERALGRKAITEKVAAPPGDVVETWADISATTRDLGWHPAIAAEEGIGRFVAWYREYYGV